MVQGTGCSPPPEDRAAPAEPPPAGVHGTGCSTAGLLAEPPPTPLSLVMEYTAYALSMEQPAMRGKFSLLELGDWEAPPPLRAWSSNGILWHLHAQLSALLLRSRPARQPGLVAALGSRECLQQALPVPCTLHPVECLQQALPCALAWLHRIWALAEAPDAAATWPAAVTAALRDATVCCWRQAVIQPLRAAEPDWRLVEELIAAIPPAALPSLEPELTRLLSGPCHCTPDMVARLKPSSCANPYWCQIRRRLLSGYLIHHPPTEIVHPLAELLPLIGPVLPPARLWSAAKAGLLSSRVQGTGCKAGPLSSSSKRRRLDAAPPGVGSSCADHKRREPAAREDDHADGFRVRVVIEEAAQLY